MKMQLLLKYESLGDRRDTNRYRTSPCLCVQSPGTRFLFSLVSKQMSCHMREREASSKEACEDACANKNGCTSIWYPDETPSSRDRYYYIFDKMNWDEANQFCKSNNSRLAVVGDWKDQEELRNITEGNATRMVERIGDAITDQAANKTMEVAGKLTSGAAVFFSKTAWIGITSTPTREPNYDFEYIWEGAPDLDNLKTGGSPRPNVYNWGWSVEFFDRESRKFTNNPRCGVIERNMWNLRNCDDDLPFVCERLGKCEVCDNSGEDNTFISTYSDELDVSPFSVSRVEVQHTAVAPPPVESPPVESPPVESPPVEPLPVKPLPVEQPLTVAFEQSHVFVEERLPQELATLATFDLQSQTARENASVRVEKVKAINGIIDLLTRL